MPEKGFESFGIVDEKGKLTNAGALLADNCPIRYSRLFCTHWNGLDKSGGKVDALDSAEYSGSLIMLLNEGVGFVKRNMKMLWKKTANSRIEMPDFCERSVFESLVNGLIHRDYLVNGSEVHIDIFDDRLVIYSPGGMPDGGRSRPAGPAGGAPGWPGPPGRTETHWRRPSLPKRESLGYKRPGRPAKTEAFSSFVPPKEAGESMPHRLLMVSFNYSSFFFFRQR